MFFLCQIDPLRKGLQLYSQCSNMVQLLQLHEMRVREVHVHWQQRLEVEIKAIRLALVRLFRELAVTPSEGFEGSSAGCGAHHTLSSQLQCHCIVRDLTPQRGKLS
jgi:hypothetical protein